MLEMLLDKKLLYVLMGILTGLGVADKCIVSMTMKRLVEAAGSMSKSNHPLMRLVRSKFEHACMISDTVENVGVFVDKYLYEYHVCGLRLHTLRRLEKICTGLLVITGLFGAGITYQVQGMGDAVLRIGACGAGLGILVWLFHLTTDENYCMQMAKNYMVDYLENVCLHKYEKINQKEKERAEHVNNVKEDAGAEHAELNYAKVQKEEAMTGQEEPAAESKSVVQMQREGRRKERAKGTARNLARASARLAGADGSKNAEEVKNTEKVKNAEAQNATIQNQETEIQDNSTDIQTDIQTDTHEDAGKELPKDEMIRQILREFMA